MFLLTKYLAEGRGEWLLIRLLINKIRGTLLIPNWEMFALQQHKKQQNKTLHISRYYIRVEINNTRKYTVDHEGKTSIYSDNKTLLKGFRHNIMKQMNLY